jgi:hypothetical protein
MNSAETFKSAIRFVIAFFVLTVINAIIWECFAARLYDCTDDGLPGYFTPGSWVHSTVRHSVAVVPTVIHGRSMSEPDTIKAGWSVTSLLCLWFLLFGISLLLSFFVARPHHAPQRTRRERRGCNRLDPSLKGQNDASKVRQNSW